MSQVLSRTLQFSPPRGELRLGLLDLRWSKVLENGSMDFSDFWPEVSFEVPEKNGRARFCRKNLDHSKKIRIIQKMDTKVVQGLKKSVSRKSSGKRLQRFCRFLAWSLGMIFEENWQSPILPEKSCFPEFGPNGPKMAQKPIFWDLVDIYCYYIWKRSAWLGKK